MKKLALALSLAAAALLGALTSSSTIAPALGAINQAQKLPTVSALTSGSGTFTTPAGARWLEVELVGGGGGGGGPVATPSGISCSGGGGAGGYIRKVITAPAASYSYAVGTAGATGTGVSGSAGGNTTFGTLTANGGAGGSDTTNSPTIAGPGGAGGTTSGTAAGDVAITGQIGGYCWGMQSAGIGSGGEGGSSPLGFGGQPVALGGGVSGGVPGTGYGAGAGGGIQWAGGGAQAGVAGQPGVIFVTVHYSNQ